MVRGASQPPRSGGCFAGLQHLERLRYAALARLLLLRLGDPACVLVAVREGELSEGRLRRAVALERDEQRGRHLDLARRLVAIERHVNHVAQIDPGGVADLLLQPEVRLAAVRRETAAERRAVERAGHCRTRLAEDLLGIKWHLKQAAASATRLFEGCFEALFGQRSVRDYASCRRRDPPHGAGGRPARPPGRGRTGGRATRAAAAWLAAALVRVARARAAAERIAPAADAGPARTRLDRGDREWL